jgi:hypothetical protein
MVCDAYNITLPSDAPEAAPITRRFASDVQVNAEAYGEG